MMDQTPKRQTEKFDDQLALIPHYQRYPVMKPFVGGDYGRHGLKFLLVGESHYLPKASRIHRDPDRWYVGGEGDLSDEEKKWLNTRNLLDRAGWRERGHTIYRNLERALSESGFPREDNAFVNVAFLNAFQRPAIYKKSIKAGKRDVQVSRDTLQGVIDVLEPAYVLFVSRKAHGLIRSHLSVPSSSVPHPACAWWNRESKRGTGKQQFINLVSGYLSAAG